MSDDDIIEWLRQEAPQRNGVKMAQLLAELTASGLSERNIVVYFKRAFPAIPLGVLREVGAWSRVGGKLSDQGFNDLLRPWLPSEKRPEKSHD